jgi:hypothetical protein
MSQMANPDRARHRLLFNHYYQLPSQQTDHFYTNNPVVELQETADVYQPTRHERQRRLKQLALANGALPFGPSLDWPYRVYDMQLYVTTGLSKDAAAYQHTGLIRREVTEPARKGEPVTHRRWVLGGQPSRALTHAERDAMIGTLDSSGASSHAAENKQLVGIVDDHEHNRLLLFNVVVGLEWAPTGRDMQQLEWAFRSASDFLYDVTDGYMAFGQVVFVGAQHMEYADIQIAASNRYMPRSWVDGLTIPSKYTPIRLGRGYWSKQRRVTIPWDEPEAFRTIVHEWGHYALGLKDLYLNRQEVSDTVQETTLVLPQISLPVESIMSSLEGTSELTAKVPGRGNGDRAAFTAFHKEFLVDEWEALRHHFPQLEISPHHVPQDGPGSLPLPLPYIHYHDLQPASEHVQDLLLTAEDTAQNAHIAHHWAYLYHEKDGVPVKLLPQGSFERRRGQLVLRLLGAAPEDTIVLIGETEDGQVCVRKGVVGEYINPTPTRGNSIAVTSLDTKIFSSSPFVDVIPGPYTPTPDAVNGLTAQLQVQVSQADEGYRAWLFQLGSSEALVVEENRFLPVADFDGHVVLRWDDGSLLIYNYSQGGGPGESGFPVGPNPISAGSSDGNALLFFWDDNTKRRKAGRYEKVRIVTTRLHGTPGGLPIDVVGPRSYTFSIASNWQFEQQLLPTLVMFFDKGRDAAAHGLTIYRYNGQAWQAILTHPEPQSFLVATPLQSGHNQDVRSETAPNLYDESQPLAHLQYGDETLPLRVERYRVFAKDHSS